MVLEGHNLCKSFGSRQVLRGVDISIAEGQITAVVGPSGGGKTTLVRALSLLDPPTSGSVAVNGHTYEFRPGEPAVFAPPWPLVTVVFQQLFLWPHLTLRHNIMLPLKTRCSKLVAQARVEELADEFQMKEFIDRYPNEVSVGQRQRAALARALALDPKFILLDEITSALDVEQIARVLSHLEQLRERGLGILVVTHLVRFARRAADQIVFLDDGAVVDAGGPGVLMQPRHERVRRFLLTIEDAS